MNIMIFPEDVDNVIQSFILVNNGDEATENLILAIGAELLDISVDTMSERIGFSKEDWICKNKKMLENTLLDLKYQTTMIPNHLNIKRTKDLIE